MIVKNFKIDVVCANKEIDCAVPIYGNIYKVLQDCMADHPTAEIMYGYYAERFYAGEPNLPETPDWFYTLEDAVEWCMSHK